MEQIEALTGRDANQKTPFCDLPSKILCRVVHIEFQAEKDTDEEFAQVSLLPEREEGIAVKKPVDVPVRNHVYSFCKTLTVSDTSTHGGFSVLKRHADECLPPLEIKLLYGSPSKRGRRKRPPSRSNSRREEQLHRIPGRMFLNGSSTVASLFTQQGKKGTNQDAMIVWENFGSRTDTVFCGVFDGHGPHGHIVARRVRDSLPLKLSAHFEANIRHDDLRQNSINTAGSMNSDETASLCLDEESSVALDSEERQPEMFLALKQTFLRAYKVMDKELKMHPNIDCFCSGTTAVTLIKQGHHLVLGNIGDSRAILGTRDQNNCLIAIQLTVDLKPNLPKEAERIRRCRGRVFALHDEPEVSRVWLPHNDSPGLAMARAFGDFCLKNFGLISVPEVSYRHITEKDEFVVLATDGVWDVLSNKEVVDIIASAPTRSCAARYLVESAVKAWKIRYPTSKVDDCAVVCFFLKSDAPEKTPNLKTGELGEPLNATGAVGNKHEPSDQMSRYQSSTTQFATEIHLDDGKEDPKPSTGNAVTGEGDDWSALEGVSRVNTLVTLPRFIADEKQQPTGTRTPK